MTDQTVIHAWGNSQGIRLNKKIIDRLQENSIRCDLKTLFL